MSILPGQNVTCFEKETVDVIAKGVLEKLNAVRAEDEDEGSSGGNGGGGGGGRGGGVSASID
jgi:hypothetical protein